MQYVEIIKPVSTPLVSIVIAALNEATTITETVDSLLKQSYSNFEIIVVNDGSTDSTSALIRDYTDKRIRLIEQNNTGLTRALINGCAEANGLFIARQDCGDISMPERLEQQVDALQSKPNIALVSMSTRFITPAKEELFIVEQSERDARYGLIPAPGERYIGPPHHGSVMFRRDNYVAAGGYREQFKVAQDIDLWTRLLDYGDHLSLKQIGYQATLRPHSISMLHREFQLEMESYIRRCTDQRKKGHSDSDILLAVSKSNESKERSKNTSGAEANYFYFLGSNLLQKNPSASLYYLSKSLKLEPIQLKALLKFCYAGFLSFVRRS